MYYVYQCCYNVLLLNQSSVQSCARGMPPPALSSEFCAVQVLEGPNYLSTLWNSEASAFGSDLKYRINGASIRTASSGCVSETTAIGRCTFREVPL